MNKKKIISGIIVAALLMSFSTAFAMGRAGGASASGAQCTGTNQHLMQSCQNNQYQNKGLTQNQERNQENCEYQQCEMNRQSTAKHLRERKLWALAEYLDIDTSDMTCEELAEAVTAAINDLDADSVAAVAGELGIDTTGMTDAQILSAIEEALTPCLPKW